MAGFQRIGDFIFLLLIKAMVLVIKRRRTNINEAALLRQPRFITIRSNGYCVNKSIKKRLTSKGQPLIIKKPLPTNLSIILR
jgi:hypothetical protein